MCLRLSRFAGGSFCWWLATSRRNATGKLLITWSVYRSSSWILSAKKLTHGLRLVLSSSPCYFQLLRLWVDAWVRRVGYTSHTGSFFSTPYPCHGYTVICVSVYPHTMRHLAN